MSNPLFKNAKQVLVLTVPSAIPPHESQPLDMTMEQVLANQALQRFVWRPPVKEEERNALVEIIKRGKIKHFITGGPKR